MTGQEVSRGGGLLVPPPGPGTVFLSPLSPPTALEGRFVIIPILQMESLKLEVARDSPEGVSLENDWCEPETQVHLVPWPSDMWTKTSVTTLD